MFEQKSVSELNREELHDLAWSKSGVQLSAEYGISDVAIAKHCKNLHVPRPPRGHWAKLRAGKKSAKKPLPPLPPTADELFARAVKKPLPKSLPLPGENSTL